MSHLRLLLDVDAVCKLAHWRVLPKVADWLGVTWSECATLSSLRFRASKAITHPDGRLFKDAQVAKEASAIISQMSPMPAPEVSELAPFEDVSGIDSGEAVLLANMSTRPGCTLLTGDKRAIRALGPMALPLQERLAGRVHIIEQAVHAALDREGLDWLRTNVCPWRDLDKAVANVMGSRCDLAEGAVREGLLSYTMEMRNACCPSLISAHPPPSISA